MMLEAVFNFNSSW